VARGTAVGLLGIAVLLFALVLELRDPGLGGFAVLVSLIGLVLTSGGVALEFDDDDRDRARPDPG